MKERMSLNMEDLELVNGGTIDDTRKLVWELALNNYGSFAKAGPNGGAVADYDKLNSFFASKGYTFLYSEYDDTPNLYAKDGRSITTDEMIKLINAHTL